MALLNKNTIIKFFKQRSHQKGQGLLEIILVLAVFGLYSASFGTLVIGGFRALEQGSEQVQAEALAQEGFEAVRSIKNRAWNENTYTQSGVDAGGGSWHFLGEGTTETIGQYTRRIVFSDICRDSSHEIVGCPGDYTDLHAKKVTVTVEWENRGGVTNSVEHIGYLTNWDSTEWTQTDWSGGPGQPIWSDASRYDSDNGNITLTPAGQISLTGGGVGSVCTGNTWGFDTTGDYTYDPNKISVQSSRAQLVSGLTSSSSGWTFTSTSDYTYNPTKIQITGGVAQLFESPPGVFPNDRPTIEPITSLSVSTVYQWTSFTETANKNSGEIYYQLSINNGSTWLYWDGSSWSVAGSTNYTTASVINSNIGTLATSTGQIMFRAFLESDGTFQVQLDNLVVGYTLSPPDANTVALWHLNDTGGQLIDVTGNGNHLTVLGNTTYSVPAQFDEGILFDGNNDYAEISDSSQTGLDPGSAMTIDFWYRPNSVGNRMLALKWGGGSNRSYRVFIQSNGRIYFQHRNNSANIATVSSSAGTIQAGQWYHVAAVYDGSWVRLFVNGTSVASPTAQSGTTYDSNVEFQISSSGNSSADAIIDEVRFSNVARWTSNFAPPTAPYGDPSGYATDIPSINPTASYAPVSVDTWSGFSETANKNGGEIYYQLSDDNGTTWYYWDGSLWTVAGGNDYNTAAEINNNIYNFPVTNAQIMFRAFLESDGTQQVQLLDVTVLCSSLQMEVGTVSTDEQWATVSLTNTYTNPVVFTSYFENNNSLPASVRLRNVGTSSFDLRLHNPNDGDLSSDTISYIVIEKGVWFIDGIRLEVNTHTTNTVGSRFGGWNYDTISFAQPFSNAPIVLHQVQTENDSSWVTSYVSRNGQRSQPPGQNDFALALNGAEVTTSHGAETIGWLAIEPAQTGTISDSAWETYQTSDSVRGHDNGCYTFSFQNSYSNSPIAFLAQQEMDDTNGGWGVACSLNNTQIGLHVEEDQANDSERSHNTETFAFLAFDESFVYGPGGGSGYDTSGELISSAFNMSDPSPVQVIEWDENTSGCSPTCFVQVQIQVAPDISGSPGAWTTTWSGPEGDDSDETDFFSIATGELVHVSLNDSQWLRYKVILTGDGTTTPIVEEIRINYK